MSEQSVTDRNDHSNSGNASSTVSDDYLRARMPVERDALYYNMNHKHRGMAIIFNHEHFDYRKLRNREGTNFDRRALEERFQNLNFEVTIHDNLTVEQLKRRIEEAATKDHSDCDCFVMCVLTHGDPGVLYAKDKSYSPEILWEKFSADVCPTLAGKPKLFIIQACQGEDAMLSVNLCDTEFDGPLPSYNIPTHADFLIACSTVPGYLSWRNSKRGTWFIQALCQELQRSGHEEQLLNILTFTNRRVAIDYETSVLYDSRYDLKKQIPCFTSMLTRIVKFLPKNNV